MAAKFKVAYHIKTETRNGEEKSHFNRIGVVFINKDGSLNAKLDYIPASEDGTYNIHIRDYEPKEKKESDSFSE
jgi:hypothetical protein